MAGFDGEIRVCDVLGEEEMGRNEGAVRVRQFSSCLQTCTSSQGGDGDGPSGRQKKKEDSTDQA